MITFFLVEIFISFSNLLQLLEFTYEEYIYGVFAGNSPAHVSTLLKEGLTLDSILRLVSCFCDIDVICKILLSEKPSLFKFLYSNLLIFLPLIFSSMETNSNN